MVVDPPAETARIESPRSDAILAKPLVTVGVATQALRLDSMPGPWWMNTSGCPHSGSTQCQHSVDQILTRKESLAPVLLPVQQ